MAEHAVQPRTYLLIALALMGLLGLTVGVAYLPLGPFSVVVALVIAAVKAGLVALFFMHLKWDSPLVRLFALAGLLWLSLVIAGTLNDVLTRTGPPFVQQAPPAIEATQDPGTS